MNGEAAGGIPIPPIYGYCPVCNHAMVPRSSATGELTPPLVNAGPNSRARCGSCQCIIQYVGNGKWRIYAIPPTHTRDN